MTDETRLRVPARAKASLLWGLVGSLSFLVLVQAYHLTAGSFLGIWVMLGVAASVGVLTAGLTYLVRSRLAGNRSRNETS
ncbi:hypothetical protein [Halovenus marina]|uniref:hypothetical protein n=1 Tax=Halovenus marina TaxID=3396621 RepID=UPI003F543D9A